MEFYKLFLLGSWFLLSSCLSSSINEGKLSSLPESSPVKREVSKTSDPKKQEKCRSERQNQCEEDRFCKKLCDDIFSLIDRKDCYELSSDVVYEFEKLISSATTGDIDEIESIGPDILECMLDIDEKEFAKAIRKINQRDAKKFILMVIDNEDFSAVLEEEDDEFNILKQILNKAGGGSNLTRILSQEIDGYKSFLWIAGERNESFWDWMDSYVDDICDKGDSSECPGGEKIGAYCKALQESDFSRSDWRAFLSNTNLFEEEYQDEVEDEDYEYKIRDNASNRGDFRDFCDMKTN